MLVFDIFVVAIFVITVVRYWIKGLTGVVLDIAAYIASAIAASVLGMPIGSLLFESAVEKALAETAVTEHFLTPKSIAGAIGFVVIFIVAFIICKIVFSRFNKLFNIPVIGLINSILGAALGLVLGYLFIQVVVLAVFVPIQLVPAINESYGEVMEASVVARWFYENNLIRLLLNLH